jgi:hypothetical protein
VNLPETVLTAALAYAKRGWSVVPVVPRDKRPLIPWREFQGRIATDLEIRGWYRRWPEANVAIVTGAVSRLVVLDVDPRHGGDDSLRDLERAHRPLPSTIESITGGGGRHVYFRHPGGLVRNLVGLAPGIDLRGDGGLVVAPPSIHPSGRGYAWEVSHHPDDVDIAPLPRWIAARHSARDRPSGHSAEHWRALLREGVPEGRRNATIASVAGHLLWHGIDAEVACELLLCWNSARCRPPLEASEVVSTVENIVRLHERNPT